MPTNEGAYFLGAAIYLLVGLIIIFVRRKKDWTQFWINLIIHISTYGYFVYSIEHSNTANQRAGVLIIFLYGFISQIILSFIIRKFRSLMSKNK